MRLIKIYTAIFAILITIFGCSSSNQVVKNSKVTNSNLELKYLDSNFRNKALNYLNSIRISGTKCMRAAPPLKYNIDLEKAAFAHARDMAINNSLQHTGSGTSSDIAKKSYNQGSIFYERIQYFGYPIKAYDLAGETITYTKANKDLYSAYKEAIKKLIHDPEHCKILMNPRFQNVGISYYKTKDRYYWVINLAENRIK